MILKALPIFWLATSTIALRSLSVQITGPSSVNGVEQLKLFANLTNTGDETIKVLHDPRSALCSLPTEAFSVVSRNTGLSPTFVGALAKFVPEDAAHMRAWTTLLPHTSVLMEKDLSHSYDFRPVGEGAYTFEPYSTFIVIDDATGSINPLKASVTKHQVDIHGKLYAERSTVPQRRANFIGCSDLRQQQLANASMHGQAYAYESATYLSSLAVTSSRYNQWFGSYTTERSTLVLNHFSNINSHSFNDYTYNCNCTLSGVYAYVYPDVFGVVYLCEAFWRAPVTGTNSQAGTLVHESSHFTLNGGTKDYVYGQTSCTAVALVDPDKATMTADCHEYFAENTSLLLR